MVWSSRYLVWNLYRASYLNDLRVSFWRLMEHLWSHQLIRQPHQSWAYPSECLQQQRYSWTLLLFCLSSSACHWELVLSLHARSCHWQSNLPSVFASHQSLALYHKRKCQKFAIVIKIKYHLQFAPIPLLVLTDVDAANAAAKSGSISMLSFPLEATYPFRISICSFTHYSNGWPTTVLATSIIHCFGTFLSSLPSGAYWTTSG